MQREFDPDVFSTQDQALFRSVEGRLAALQGHLNSPDEFRDHVKKLARSEGMEVATATVFAHVRSMPANASLARAVASFSKEEARSRPDVRIGLVPGAFYREHHHTGANGAEVARILHQMGHAVEIIPVHSFGSLAENAAVIGRWLDRQEDTPIVLISLSKGACDVKTVLAEQGRAARVAAWISLSGISTGTPLVAWLRRRPWRWCGVWLLLKMRRQRIHVLRELRHGSDSPLGRWPASFDERRLIHVHGFPTERHLVHPWAHRAYRRLAPLGPNDGGGVLLTDVTRWPGRVFPLWGVDHYLQPKRPLQPVLRRLFQVVIDHLS